MRMVYDMTYFVLKGAVVSFLFTMIVSTLNMLGYLPFDVPRSALPHVFSLIMISSMIGLILIYGGAKALSVSEE